MKISYQITTTAEGSLAELINHPNPYTAPSLDEVLATMEALAFIVETVAHLQGKEAALLPSAEKARKQIAALQSHTA
jgi:hypothetical protein